MSSLMCTESHFEFKDLFFSRTNLKGVIVSGNSVFQRISKFEWNELLDHPHNIIRHPLMPRGVFHLLWKTILEGNEIGAYVLNQAKDKSHYWVFALVTPIDGGFISIRLKPSSPFFDIVKDKYTHLLETEKLKKITPLVSQDLLLQEIKNLQFSSYRHFMTEALILELEYRQKAMALPPIKVITHLREVAKLGSFLQKKCEEILVSYFKNSKVPINLEIQAMRLGAEAVSISIIATHYSLLAKQIKDENLKFIDAVNLVQKKLGNCQFDVCNLLLQREMFYFFQNEDQKNSAEMSHLEDLGNFVAIKAKTALYEIEDEYKKFTKIYDQVCEHAIALDIVSITGKIETAKISGDTSGLNVLFLDLTNFKIDLKNSLKSIDEAGTNLIHEIQEIKNELSFI